MNSHISEDVHSRLRPRVPRIVHLGKQPEMIAPADDSLVRFHLSVESVHGGADASGEEDAAVATTLDHALANGPMEYRAVRRFYLDRQIRLLYYISNAES